MSQDIDVTIKAYRDPQAKPDGIRFEMTSDHCDPRHPDTLVCSKQVDKMEADQPHHVTFTLRNEKGLDLRFLKDEDEVMWTAAGNADKAPDCPKKSGRDSDFTIEEIRDHHLKVDNWNNSERKHKFVLNFIGTKANGDTGLIQYDPIWDNRNGSAR